jgi:NAD(P)-dependent dehydrogenase (short-subunit alcohol dehydrogenase family)
MSLQSLLNPAPPPPFKQQNWLVIGASSGVGLEFCTQLLAAGHRVVGTARAATGTNELWTLTGTPNGGNLTILECDVTNEESVERFVEAVRKFGTLKRGRAGGMDVIDVVVVNAGVVAYPNRAMEM